MCPVQARISGAIPLLRNRASRPDYSRAADGGTTSLIVAFPETTEDERRFYAELASRDPHARLRAVRIAKREAASRAPGPLGRAACEIKTSVDPKGVRIDVDVQAPLIVERRTGMRDGRRSPPPP